MWWLACAWAGSEAWELSERTFWTEEGLRHATELGELDVAPGAFVFPVERDGTPVGVVLVGEADWAIRFESAGEARALANRRVVSERDDPLGLVEVAAGRTPLQLGVDRGLWLGRAVWDEVLPDVDEVTEHDGVLIREASAGHEEVLVTAHIGVDRARRIAERTLRERTTWMRTHQFDPDAFVHYPERMRAVTLKGANDALRARLSPEDLSIVVVAGAPRVRDELAKLRGVRSVEVWPYTRPVD